MVSHILIAVPRKEDLPEVEAAVREIIGEDNSLRNEKVLLAIIIQSDYPDKLDEAVRAAEAAGGKNQGFFRARSATL